MGKALWTKILVFLAIGIFLINMGMAWKIIFASNEAIAQPLVGPDSGVKKALDMVSTSNVNTTVFLSRVVEAEAHLKSITNHQTTIVVAMAAAFGLIAVGFALFVMGAEGAIELKGEAGNSGTLFLKATSPGVVGFVLGAVIITIALLQKHPLEFGELRYTPDGTQRGTNDSTMSQGPELPELPSEKAEAGKENK